MHINGNNSQVALGGSCARSKKTSTHLTFIGHQTTDSATHCRGVRSLLEYQPASSNEQMVPQRPIVHAIKKLLGLIPKQTQALCQCNQVSRGNGSSGVDDTSAVQKHQNVHVAAFETVRAITHQKQVASESCRRSCKLVAARAHTTRAKPEWDGRKEQLTTRQSQARQSAHCLCRALTCMSVSSIHAQQPTLGGSFAPPFGAESPANPVAGGMSRA